MQKDHRKTISLTNKKKTMKNNLCFQLFRTNMTKTNNMTRTFMIRTKIIIIGIRKKIIMTSMTRTVMTLTGYILILLLGQILF